MLKVIERPLVSVQSQKIYQNCMACNSGKSFVILSDSSAITESQGLVHSSFTNLNNILRSHKCWKDEKEISIEQN